MSFSNTQSVGLDENIRSLKDAIRKTGMKSSGGQSRFAS